MKKGFTLIELLAVIVILAIISVIAIPIVIKVIDNAKVGSLKVSMSNIEKAIELYINKNQIKENKTFTCSDGVCIDELNNKLEVSGIVPEDGTINITPSGTITYNKLIIDGYLCDKYNKEFVCNKASKNIEETKEESIIIKNTDTTLNNYKIYGNSVQNTELNKIEIVGENTKNLINSDYLLTNPKISKVKNGYYVENYANWVSGITEHLKAILKPNVTYTLSRVYTGELKNSNGMIGIRFKDGTSITLVKYGKGLVSGTFTLTQEQIDSIAALYLYFHNDGATISNIQLEEGDTATDYEPYGYKIPVKVLGKNLLNPQEITGLVSQGPVDGAYMMSSTTYKGLILKCKPNTKYTFIQSYSTGRTRVLFFNENPTNTSIKSIGGWIYDNRLQQTFVTSENTYYLGISLGSNENFTNDYKVWLVEGGYSDYEPYTEIETNIYLDSPLRKVGNYVDYIDYKNQKEVRNVGVLNLSSEDNFELIDNYFVLNLESYPKKDKELSISNYLEYGSNYWFDGNKLKLKIEGINTIEELKEWLSNNNVVIYYPLSKSVVSDIELPEIKLNKNYSNINIESNIKPSNFLIEYD